MNKFITRLSSSSEDIKGHRATLLNGDAESSADQLIRTLKDDLRALKKEENSLSDLYPESELSLRVTRADFNTDDWTQRQFSVRRAIKLKEVDLAIAEDFYSEWFGDKEE